MGRATPLTAYKYERGDNKTGVHRTPSTPARSCCSPNYLQQRRLRFQTHVFAPFTSLLLCIKTGRRVGWNNCVLYCSLSNNSIRHFRGSECLLILKIHVKVASWQLVAKRGNSQRPQKGIILS